MKDEETGAPRDLNERLLDFAARVGLMYRELPNGKMEEAYGMQVVRPSSSVGAQMREAKRDRSNAEFISKCQSAQQELEETQFWFELLVKVKIAPESRMSSLIDEAEQLMKIISSWVVKAKQKC